MRRLTVSIVVYESSAAEIEPLLRSLQKDELVLRWVVVDNRNSSGVQKLVESLDGAYLSTGRNEGFGKAHNLALRSIADVPSDYHLILNPDIAFDGNALAALIALMDSHLDVGLVMPKVLYPDGSIQYLCKLLPAPIDLVLRRFLPESWKSVAQKRIASYELRNLDYDAPAYVPSLSGCFMFARRSVLDAVGGFDERFFLYMEDVDLCRRMLAVSRLLYWPGVTVEHVHQMGSYRNRKLLFLHVRSAIKYFNKWGWIRDCSRTEINRATLASMHKS